MTVIILLTFLCGLSVGWLLSYQLLVGMIHVYLLDAEDESHSHPWVSWSYFADHYMLWTWERYAFRPLFEHVLWRWEKLGFAEYETGGIWYVDIDRLEGLVTEDRDVEEDDDA